MPTPVPAYLDKILDLVRDDDAGELADYIESLRTADPDKLCLLYTSPSPRD